MTSNSRLSNKGIANMTDSLQPVPARNLKWAFWNAAERRPRAGWRLLLHILVMAVSVFLVQLAVRAIFELLLERLLGANRALNAAFMIFESQLTWVSIILSMWVMARFFDRRPFKDFGFAFRPRWWIDFAFGLVLGALLMAVIFAVEYALGWVQITGTYQTNASSFTIGILLYVGLFISVGIQEEALTRGYWMKNIAEAFNLSRRGPGAALAIAYIITSSIFGLLHMGNPNASWVSTLSLIAAGLFLGLPCVLTGSLAIPIGVHMTWNFFQGCVFGFPVSGGAPGTTYIAIRQAGPDLWTGGAFGPEAGLIGIAAILIGAALVLLWLKITRGQVRWHGELAVYHAPSQVDRTPVPDSEI